MAGPRLPIRPAGVPHVQLGRTAHRNRSALALLAACFGLSCAGSGFLPQLPEPGAVEGRVLSGEAPGTGEWVVVYLGGPSLDAKPSAASEAAVLRSREGELVPAVLAVSAGQRLTLRAEDGLHHRFFSTSRPHGFAPLDVPGGESRQLSLAQPGVLRVYCSLHPREEGTVVVAPSRHFSVLRAPGGYALREVPPGDYALYAWSESRDVEQLPVHVMRGESTFVEIDLGSDRDS